MNKAEVILKLIKRGFYYYKHNDKPIVLGEKIVVIASGPDAHLYFDEKSQFEEYDVLVMNSYPLKSDNFFELKPKYYAAIDPMYFKPNKEAYNGYLSDDILQLYKVLEKVDWEMHIVVNGDSKFPIDNKNIKYIRMGYGLTLPYKMSNYQKKLVFENRALPNSQTVMVHALLFSLIFGYRDIAIFGLNMNELQNLRNDMNNCLWFDHDHFYGKEKSVALPCTYIEEINYFLAMLLGFETVSELAKDVKAKIINYSVNSYVQSFEKKQL